VAEMVTNLFFGITLRYGRLRWASSLKQQSSIIVYRLATKENKLLFLFAASKRKFVVSVFHLQQKKRTLLYSLVLFSVCIVYMCCRFKWVTEAQTIFLNLFTFALMQTEVCRLFVDKETNRSYPFANRL
jgi:hypothetical protein